MGSPDSQATPSAVAAVAAAVNQRRASTVNGTGPATNGSRASDHDNSSDDEAKDRGDGGSEGARKRRRIDGISS
jgi:hypothetical protein